MGKWNEPWVLDEEAYRERAAIMIVESNGVMSETDMYSLAAQDGYKTRFSVAATAAIRGDWEPAKKLCRKQPEGYGKELMRAIQEAVKAKQALM